MRFGLGSNGGPSPAMLPALLLGGDKARRVTGALTGLLLCPWEEQLLLVPLSTLGRLPAPSRLFGQSQGWVWCCSPGEGGPGCTRVLAAAASVSRLRWRVLGVGGGVRARGTQHRVRKHRVFAK